MTALYLTQADVASTLGAWPFEPLKMDRGTRPPAGPTSWRRHMRPGDATLHAIGGDQGRTAGRITRSTMSSMRDRGGVVPNINRC